VDLAQLQLEFIAETMHTKLAKNNAQTNSTAKERKEFALPLQIVTAKLKQRKNALKLNLSKNVLLKNTILATKDALLPPVATQSLVKTLDTNVVKEQ